MKDLPAPPPDMVVSARAHLANRFADGVDELMWEARRQPMPDTDAIKKVLAQFARGGDLLAPDLAAALIVMQAVRLDLDRLEADLLDAVRESGMTWDQVALVLGLPDAAAAQRRYQQMAVRRELPVAEVDVRGLHGDPTGPVDPADRPQHGSGRGSRQP
ncbi:MAG: hypothetical protein ABIS86_08740 [Streptosporangiaceae bacterium]